MACGVVSCPHGRGAKKVSDDVAENLVRMSSGIDLRVGLHDLAVAIDQVANAVGALGVSTVAGAVEQAHFAARVAEKREVEVEFLGKGAVVVFRVEADAENSRVLVFVSPDLVTEPATLRRSPGCIGFRVEP